MRWRNKWLVAGLILFSLIVVTFLLQRQKQARIAKNEAKIEIGISQNTTAGSDENSERSNSNIPEKVYKVLRYVSANNKAPKGYVGGREFKNRERKLAARTKEGRKIFYREWDVNPKKAGVNRGAERLVTGDDNRAWYTNNHYKTFKEVIERQ